jgi:hypothetical protein
MSRLFNFAEKSKVKKSDLHGNFKAFAMDVVKRDQIV